MAKDLTKVQAKVVKDAPLKGKQGTIWKIQIAPKHTNEVMIDVEPGDAEKYWSRLAPTTFLCEDGQTYKFTAPEQAGFDQFEHWEHPRTDSIVTTETTLVLDAVKRNDRYVAVYKNRVPCDVVFHGVSSKNNMKVVASKPDINGRTEIVTPGRLTYMFGDRVTFTVEREIEVPVPDTLYKHLVERYTFTGWKHGADYISKDQSLQLDISRKGHDITVAYVKTPAPYTPDERQVHNMMNQMNLMYTSDTSGVREFVVLVNGQPVKLMGKLLFPTKENAEAVLRGSFKLDYKNWLNRLPEKLKEWGLNEGQREAFFSYWLKNSVQIVPYSHLVITKKKDV